MKMQEEPQYNLIIFVNGNYRFEIITGSPLPRETIIKVDKIKE